MTDCKFQILSTLIKNKKCSQVFLSTLLLLASEKSNKSILIHANEEILDFASICLNEYPVEINSWSNNLYLTGDIETFINNIEFENFQKKLLSLSTEDKLTYLKTAFILYGNFYYNSDSTKNSTGYHLEISFKSKDIAELTSIIFAEFGIDTKLSNRAPYVLLYSKNSSTICDILVLLGAQYVALEIQNSLAMREIRNETNRQNNCFESNLDKTISASTEQLNAINYILENYSLEYLDENLREVALARLTNPDVSLKDLQTILNNSLTRAGIKYRLDKIISLYKRLKGDTK